MIAVSRNGPPPGFSITDSPPLPQQEDFVLTTTATELLIWEEDEVDE